MARGLATYAWSDPTLTPGSTPAKVADLMDLRTALNQAYLAALRTAVSALERGKHKWAFRIIVNARI